MGYGRLGILFILLGWVLFSQPAMGADGKLDEQQKLLDEAKQLTAQIKKMHEEGQYSQAIPFCEKALAVRRKVLGPQHPDVAMSLANLALMYSEMGQLAKAERLFLDALAILKEARAPRSPRYVMPLNNLANLYLQTGQYAKAEQLYLDALALSKELLGPRHRDVAQFLNNLAVLYGVMGQWARAEPLHLDALAMWKEVLGPQHPDVAQSLDSLAVLYTDIGQYAKAEPLAQEALAIRREALRPGHPRVASSLNDLAYLYMSMGQYAKAEPLYQEALAIWKELGPRHPSVALAMNNLGELYAEMGPYSKAELLFQEALAIRKEVLGLRHPELADSLHPQALLYLAHQGPDVALPLLKQSIDSSEQFLRTIVTESRLGSLLQRRHEQEEDVYSLLAQNAGVPAVQQLALSVALLRKGRSAEEGIKTQQAIQQALTDPQDRSLFDRLTSARSQLASLYLKEPSSVPEYRKTLAALETEADGLEQKLAQHSAAFHSMQLPTRDQIIARVAQALPKDAALLEWIAFRPRNFTARGQQPKWASPRYLALVLFPDQHIRVVDLGEIQAIDQAIEALKEQLGNRRPDYLAAAQKLHRMVLAPLLPALEGRTNLLVSPDGALNLLPLWALHDGKQFVLDTHRITYLTSGRDLLRPLAAAPPSPSITVLANPAFRPAVAQSAPAEAVAAGSRAAFLQQLQHVPSLPGTAAEARAIQKLFPQSRVLSGSEASEKALRSLQAPTVLHIATHGVFWDDRSMPQYDAAYQPGRTLKVVATSPPPSKEGSAPVNPLARSALLLAGVEALAQPGPPPPDENNGLMTALEVSSLNLWGTELVVLSACNTGRGAVQLGQGVYGLRRAFFNAGAETLVSSLWPVSDEATQELMDGYYRNLLSGQGRVEAMRQAAMAVRAKQPHPYFWAPFIVLGKGEPLHGISANR